MATMKYQPGHANLGTKRLFVYNSKKEEVSRAEGVEAMRVHTELMKMAPEDRQSYLTQVGNKEIPLNDILHRSATKEPSYASGEKPADKTGKE